MTQTLSTSRLSSREIKRDLPDLYPAIGAMSKAVDAAGLENELIDLINLRTSQINGCAYCVQMHSTSLREMGYPEAKITLAVTWEEAGIFSEREQAALAWAETITLIAHDHVPSAKYDAARAVFNDKELAGLTAAIAVMNVWNRLAVTFRYPPEV